MKQLVVAIHDVTPGSAGAVVRLREMVARRAPGPVSLLLVPRFLGDEPWRAGHFTRWTSARAAAGDELVLHGFTHITPGGTSERELAHLSATDIGNRIDLGRSVLHGVGLAPGGFVAPCYDHPRTAHLACARSALTWWATRNGLYRKGRRLLLPSLGLGASSALKRATSPSVARAAAAVLAPARSLRLDLHPADLDHRGLLAAAVDVLDRLLDQGRELTTHARLVGAPPQTPEPVGGVHHFVTGRSHTLRKHPSSLPNVINRSQGGRRLESNHP